VAFDGGVGGRLYETGNDGSETVWGEILKWDPPKGLAFSWHPGRDAQNATEVEIRFEQVADGTRISLEHRRWEQMGEKAAQMRDAYDSGWTLEIDRYVAAAGTRAG